MKWWFKFVKVCSSSVCVIIWVCCRYVILWLCVGLSLFFGSGSRIEGLRLVEVLLAGLTWRYDGKMRLLVCYFEKMVVFILYLFDPCPVFIYYYFFFVCLLEDVP